MIMKKLCGILFIMSLSSCGDPAVLAYNSPAVFYEKQCNDPSALKNFEKALRDIAAIKNSSMSFKNNGLRPLNRIIFLQNNYYQSYGLIRNESIFGYAFHLTRKLYKHYDDKAGINNHIRELRIMKNFYDTNNCTSAYGDQSYKGIPGEPVRISPELR
jgi:hypothetical protein